MGPPAAAAMRAIGPILVLSLFRAQTPDAQLAPEVLALAHASRLVRETVDALANCACLESVTRSTTDKSGKLKRDRHDTLQIEATTIGDREWFSWPGGKDAFVEDPRALVSFGLFNTGQLTSNLKTVFLGGYAVRRFHGAVTVHARPALQFDYSVSPVFTRFLVSSAEGSVRAGMKGSFWIDTTTSELLALTNDATEIPADFDIRSGCLTSLGIRIDNEPLPDGRGSVSLAKSTRPFPSRDRQGAVSPKRLSTHPVRAHRSGLCSDVSGRPERSAAANLDHGGQEFHGRGEHQSRRFQSLPPVLQHQCHTVRRR